MSHLFNIPPIIQSIRAICEQRSIRTTKRDWIVLRYTLWAYVLVSPTSSVVKMASMFESIRDERYTSHLILWDRFTRLATPICLLTLIALTAPTIVSGLCIMDYVHSTTRWHNFGIILGSVQGLGICAVFWKVVQLADLQGIPRRIRQDLLDHHDVPSTFFDKVGG